MTGEEARIEEVLKRCVNVHLPDDFADRLVERIQESRKPAEKKSSIKSAFVRIALVAASLTLLLGFVPRVLDRSPGDRTEVVAHCDEIRSTAPVSPQDNQMNALALLGFCREVIRRRVRSLLVCVRSRKREEEE